MFKEEEEKLAEMKEKYQKLPIPTQIDTYIMVGMEQASRSRKRKLRTTFSTLGMAMLLVLFLVTIRVSPVFASYVGQVPGLDRLVALIQGDKGLKAAVENNFVQVIGKSDTHNGIRFIVDEIVADESKMVIFYTLESDQSYDFIMLSEAEITDESGNAVKAVTGYDSHNDGIEKGEAVKGKIDIDFGRDTTFPEQITITTNMNVESETLEQPWVVSFSVDQEKFLSNKEVYPLDKTVTVEGQKLTFKEVLVYPTKMAIHVKYDEQNTKELFGFDDLAVVNEKGEEWATINGVSGLEISENEEIFFLQSNFFEMPKEIYLTFSSIRALDKDKLDVVIDLEQGKLLKRPNAQMELLSVSKGTNIIDLEFLMNSTNPFDIDHFYDIFDYRYSDEGGNEYEKSGFGSYTGEKESEYVTYFSVKKPSDGNTITLRINDYPSRITDDVKVKLK